MAGSITTGFDHVGLTAKDLEVASWPGVVMEFAPQLSGADQRFT